MTERRVQGPAFLAGFARAWMRMSPSLVPALAVVSALILSTVFMIGTRLLSSGRVDIGSELSRTFTAYSGLLEGALGVAANDLASSDDLILARALAEQENLTRSDLRRWVGSVDALNKAGMETILRYGELLARFPDLTDEQVDELGTRVPQIREIGEQRLRAMRPLIATLFVMERDAVSDLAARYAAMSAITPEDRAELEQRMSAVRDLSDAALLDYLRLVNAEGIVKLDRVAAQLDVLDRLVGLSASSPEALDFAGIAALGTANVRPMVETAAKLESAGIFDTSALLYQLRFTGDLYEANVLIGDPVATAIGQELDAASQTNLIVRRPGQVDRLLLDRGSASVGMVWNPQNTPDDPSDDRPQVVYARAGGSALLFLPGNLETMIVRAMPFVIAGLAVALSFKAGLFNIGATGQLYMGSILAAWVGFAYPFNTLPAVLHLPLVLAVGIMGGMLWGAIPGVLKAYTGAHEVINTIMLNWIAIRLSEWLIKSKDPYILRDPAATTDQTPMLVPSARIPSFDELSAFWYIAAGVVVLAWGLWMRRERLRANPRLAIRPALNGALVAVGGLFLSWTAVAGNLHLGLLLMIGAVWFSGWFLDRTTLGFELRTVGANPDAARYAGMNVKWNIILAMVLSGAFAGLAGTTEVAGVQFNMKPQFFADLGFDAIAVALLARTKPRNMILAGALWGSLLAGAGLMQVRANISVDLVKIIQALIIMFVAADAIIRYLYRLPKARAEEAPGSTFSKGWSA